MITPKIVKVTSTANPPWLAETFGRFLSILHIHTVYMNKNLPTCDDSRQNRNILKRCECLPFSFGLEGFWKHPPSSEGGGGWGLSDTFSAPTSFHCKQKMAFLKLSNLPARHFFYLFVFVSFSVLCWLWWARWENIWWNMYSFVSILK